jgi:hypothetical protein
LIRYLIALLGVAAITGYVRQRYMRKVGPSLQDSGPAPDDRDWMDTGQDLSFVLLGLGIAAAAVAFILRIGPLFEAGMLAVVGAGGVWGVCEAAKGFR